MAIAWLSMSTRINAVEAILSDDAMVSFARPSANYAHGRLLAIRKRQPVFLKFDLSPLPDAASSEQITKATLKIWFDRVEKAGTFDISAATSAWGEKTITGETMPSLNAPEIEGVEVHLAQQKQFMSFDVTPLVRDWVEGNTPNHGLVLMPTTESTVFALIASKENLGTGHLPQLEINFATFTENPESGPLNASSLVTGTVPNQRLDTELQALASLSSAADKLPFFTGNGAAAVTDLTAAARSLIDDADIGRMRDTLALQDRTGTTPLVNRRLLSGANLRVLILGDSIAPGMLYADDAGALRILQNHIGNAGAGGIGVNSEQIHYFDGAAAYAAENWFRRYVKIPASSSCEFAMTSPSRGRRWANTAKVAWRAPVDGTATFKIQTCSDADGAGAGTWVDQGGIRTASATGNAEDVSSATIDLPEGGYRLRVLGISGMVDVFNMELSHSNEGGCVVIPHNEGSTAFAAWAALSSMQRASFISAINPDVIFVAYKDDGPTMTSSLSALGETLRASPSNGYPRDVVILAPFPTVVSNNATETPEGMSMYHQREAMRRWAVDNRATFIDLWDLAPAADIYYDGGGVHLAGTAEHAHFGHLIIDRLGWLRSSSSQAKAQPITRMSDRREYMELANGTNLTEDNALRVKGLTAGRWRLSGFLLFTNDGSAGEGAKAQIDFSSGATLSSYRWDRFQTNGTPVRYAYPAFGNSVSLPFILDGLTLMEANQAYGFEFLATINVTNPGDVIVRIAKEATGGAVYIREGSFLEAKKL